MEIYIEREKRGLDKDQNILKQSEPLSKNGFTHNFFD